MTKAFTLQKPKRSRFSLVDKRTANLLREQFPYTEVPRILFDGVIVNPTPGKEIWITDTTFRDGQPARAPYKPEQIVQLYDYLHRLGGPNGLIRQCEFFVYSTRGREAITGCQELGHRYPEITGWIRANAEDRQSSWLAGDRHPDFGIRLSYFSEAQKESPQNYGRVSGYCQSCSR